jgi:large subunit ribosomal protein L10
MPNQKKISEVAALTERFKNAQVAIMADYRGLNAAQAENLRLKVREAGFELKVCKNRLVKLAIQNSGGEALNGVLTGPTIVAFGVTDPVAPAKVLTEFAKTNDKLKIKGGLLEGKAVNAAMIEQLAKMPSREELLSRLLGDLKSPISRLATVIENARGKIVHAVDAVRRKQEEAA